MLKMGINQIIELGISDDMNQLDKRKLRLLNVLYLISIISSLSFAVWFFIIDFYGLMALSLNCLLFSVIWILGLLLNKYNKLYFSQHFLASTLTLVVIINTFIIAGTAASIHFYFILFSVAPLLIWKLKDIKPFLFYFSINMICFLYAHIFFDSHNMLVVYPKAWTVSISIVTISGTLVSLLAALWVSIKFIEDNEKELKQQTLDLNTLLQTVTEQNASMLMQQEELESLNVQLLEKNSKLEELNATKDKFFSIISHDLKNPLHVMHGFTDLLLDKDLIFTAEKQHEILHILNKTIVNTQELLENLLTWSNNQKGMITYSPIDVSLKYAIQSTLDQVSSIANKKEICIICNELSNKTVRVDITFLDIILRNIITNAIKFSNRKSVIVIDVQLLDNKLYITVKDSGVGMTESELTQLFKLSTSVSKTGTENEKGTGLGLLLCKDLIEKMGGYLTISSKKDIGTEISFFIPQN